MFPTHVESWSENDLTVVSIETQGWRPEMQDFILNEKIAGLDEEPDHIFGIFDGHGGMYISLLCKIIMPKIIEHNI